MTRRFWITIAALALAGCDNRIQRPAESDNSSWLRIERTASYNMEMVIVACDTKTGTLLYLYTGRGLVAIPGGCER